MTRPAILGALATTGVLTSMLAQLAASNDAGEWSHLTLLIKEGLGELVTALADVSPAITAPAVTQDAVDPPPAARSADEILRLIVADPRWDWRRVHGLPAVTKGGAGILRATVHAGWPQEESEAIPDAQAGTTARLLAKLLAEATSPEVAVEVIGARLVEAWGES